MVHVVEEKVDSSYCFLFCSGESEWKEVPLEKNVTCSLPTVTGLCSLCNEVHTSLSTDHAPTAGEEAWALLTDEETNTKHCPADL